MPPAAALTSRPVTPRKASAPGPRLVLVVDDHDDSREALAELCRLAGHDCLSAASRAEALGLLISRPPDAILLDLMLPDGNGMEVLRVVRAHHFPARVAVMTAAGPAMVAEAKALKPDAEFRKPVDLAELREWLAAP